MSIIIKAHYDGKTIVPDAELDLPQDQALEIQVRLVAPDEATTPTCQTEECSYTGIKSLPFFGMWADREDIVDGVDWTRKEREKWASRLSSQD